jgi:hypothetical protein
MAHGCESAYPQKQTQAKKPRSAAGIGRAGRCALRVPLLTAINSWAEQPLDKPTRAESLRRFAAKVLIGESEEASLKARRPEAERGFTMRGKRTAPTSMSVNKSSASMPRRIG